MNDHFARLGLPRRFAVNPAELDREYLARSREVHPDFFADASTHVRTGAEQDSAVLNEAYTVLKDPYRRAEHLLALLGAPSAAEARDIPQNFLMEMLDIREEIERLHRQRDETAAAALAKNLEYRYAQLFTRVGELFEQSPIDLMAIRRELNSAKYIRGLIRDLDT